MKFKKNENNLKKISVKWNLKKSFEMIFKKKC